MPSQQVLLDQGDVKGRLSKEALQEKKKAPQEPINKSGRKTYSCII